MNQRVDTRGLSCPQPVVLVMRAIQQGDQAFEVLLDSEVACENVRRLLGSKGFRIEETQADDGTVFRVSR